MAEHLTPEPGFSKCEHGVYGLQPHACGVCLDAAYRACREQLRRTVEPLSSNPLVLSLEDGKYTFAKDQRGVLTCDRYGQAWREFLGDHAVTALFHEIERLTAELTHVTRLWAAEVTERDRLRAALRGALECVECNDAQGAETIINVALRAADTSTPPLATETPLSWFLKQSPEFKEAVYTSALEKASDAQNAVVRAADEHTQSRISQDHTGSRMADEPQAIPCESAQKDRLQPDEPAVVIATTSAVSGVANTTQGSGKSFDK